GISSGKLRRYFDVKNFTDPFKVLKGVYDASRILSKEKPNVIFSKGGFVTVPVVIAASMKKIPVISHESDMTPGLANKMAAPFCDKLCVTFPESLKYVKGNKGVLTGTPIREELLTASKVRANNFCDFRENKMTLMIIGGSLGSKIINENIRIILKDLLKEFNIIHICGKGNLDNSLNNIDGYNQYEYVSQQLPDLMNFCDVVISRAGANTIFELLALKKPNILIPLSANASRGDQVLNANSFEKSGYSKVITEEQLTSISLLNAIKEVVKDRKIYIKNMENSNLGNGIQNILNIIKASIKE
ncbi:MAG: undecaprenyldiphospho-muramoylpentapeptide beta-N-acetylglucosaminyltransferase, partial [Sarcina sp.]